MEQQCFTITSPTKEWIFLAEPFYPQPPQLDRPPETNAIKIATVLPTTAIKKSEPVTLKLRLEEHVLETSIAQSVLTATVNQLSAKLYLPKELIVLLSQPCLECVDSEDFVLTIIAPDFSLYLMELIPLLLETTI